MFESLSEKFRGVLSYFSGKSTLTEGNIAEAVEKVRLALLDADVNYDVVIRFVERLKARAVGLAVTRSVTPGQQFIHLVHEELTALMGQAEASLDLKGKLSVLMVAGLQGAGKTTSCAKLAAFIQKKEPYKKILLAACDLQRPAAVEQLKLLGAQIGVPVFALEGATDPLVVAKGALQKGKAEEFDVLIVDTAGRLHLDEGLMKELEALQALLVPRELLFVANAATGQDAARSAQEFGRRLKMTGSILTMLDGSARAGAALSIREVTQKPLKFEGIGERITDFQLFHPRSMADRILGMGDVINLVRKTEEHFKKEDQDRLEQKLKRASFTYEDYLDQMQKVKKMGSLQSLLKMVPGLSGALGDFDASEQDFQRGEAMISSMTRRERQEKDEFVFSRRQRVAAGSGVSIDEVNRLVKGFARAKQLFKNMPSLGKGMPDLKQLKKMEGKRWR